MQAEMNPRYHMWRRLGCYCRTQRDAYAAQFNLQPFDINPMPEDELKAMNFNVSDVVQMYKYQYHPAKDPVMKMAVDTVTSLLAPLNEVCIQYDQKKETTMSYDYDNDYETPIQTRTDETKKRDYLCGRLDEINSKKRSEAREMFHMDEAQPTTLKELVEKIQAGKFMPLTKDIERQYACSIYQIDWHDPANPADPIGYRAARDAFKALKIKTMDVIAIAEPAEALTALQALEAWTPTGAAN